MRIRPDISRLQELIGGVNLGPMLRKPVSRRDWDDAHLIDVLRELHADDPTLGYRILADELSDQGSTASENRV